MSTEGSVGIAINITDNFTDIQNKITTLNASITSLDTNISKTRTINVKALLQTTKFDEQIAAIEVKEHIVKVKIDPSILQKSITDTIAETVHTIKTTVNLSDVNSIITSSFAESHPINVTVNPTELESKVEAAVKNKSYPVKIDFTPDSAVGSSLSGISSAMKDIARLTGEINKLTKTALGDLNTQMTTYFNDLNHILDLTNKVAETVEKSVTKKAAAIEKAAAVELASANKLAEQEIAIEEKKSADINKIKIKEFNTYVVGSTAMVDQRIKLELLEVQALRDVNQRKVENFQSMLRVILDGQKLVIDSYKKEQDAIAATIEAKKRLAMTSSNLGSGTFENTGRTGSKQQGSEVTLPAGLGGTGVALSKQQADADLLHKQGVDALRSFYEQVAVITHEANSAHEKEFMRAFTYEEYMTKAHTAALAEEASRYTKMLEDAYSINKRVTDDYHNTVIKAFNDELYMNKKHTDALAENMVRHNAMHEEALKINKQITDAYQNSVIATFYQEEAMTKKHIEALAEDMNRYNKIHQEALDMNRKITDVYQKSVIQAFEQEEFMTKKHNEALAEEARRNADANKARGAALNTGSALAISHKDIEILREYRAEQERLHGSTNNLSQSMFNFNNVLMQLGIYMSGRQVLEYADQWIHFTSMVRIATADYLDSIGTLSESQKSLFTSKMTEDVFKISQETRTGLHDTANLFMRMSRAAEAMGMDFDKAKVLTEQLGKSMMVMGLSPAMARGALLQLEQALGGVVVRGQEFKSVNDGLPIVMRTIAKHYNEQKATLEGLSIGYKEGSDGLIKYVAANKGLTLGLKDLRELMLDRKMYSSVAAAALTSKEAIEEMNKAAENMHVTFGQGFTIIENGFIRYIGELNDATHASGAFFKVATSISENFDLIGSVIASVIVPLGSFIITVGVAELAVKMFNLAVVANPLTKFAAILVTLGVALTGFAATHGDVVDSMTGYWKAFLSLWDNPEDNSWVRSLKNVITYLDEIISKFLGLRTEAEKAKGIESGIKVNVDESTASGTINRALIDSGRWLAEKMGTDKLFGGKDEATVGPVEAEKNRQDLANAAQAAKDEGVLAETIEAHKANLKLLQEDAVIQKKINELKSVQKDMDEVTAKRAEQSSMNAHDAAVRAVITAEAKQRDVLINKGNTNEGSKFNTFEVAKIPVPEKANRLTQTPGYYNAEDTEKLTAKGLDWQAARDFIKSATELAEKEVTNKENEIARRKAEKEAPAKAREELADQLAIKKILDSTNEREDAMRKSRENSDTKRMDVAHMSSAELEKQLTLTQKMSNVPMENLTMKINVKDVETDLNEMGGAVERSTAKIGTIVRAAADKYGVDYKRMLAMVKTESEGYADAVSGAGAKGFSQLMPATGKHYGLKPEDFTNAEKSLDAMGKYMKHIQEMPQFKDKPDLQTAAYNSGENLQAYKEGRIPKIKETENYVVNVTKLIATPDALDKFADQVVKYHGVVVKPIVQYDKTVDIQRPVGQATAEGTIADKLKLAEEYANKYREAYKKVNAEMQSHPSLTREEADAYNELLQTIAKGSDTAESHLKTLQVEADKISAKIIDIVNKKSAIDNAISSAESLSKLKSDTNETVNKKGWDAIPELKAKAEEYSKSVESLTQQKSKLESLISRSGSMGDKKGWAIELNNVNNNLKVAEDSTKQLVSSVTTLNDKKLDKATNEANNLKSALADIKIDRIDFTSITNSIKQLTDSMQGSFGEAFDRISSGFGGTLSAASEAYSGLTSMSDSRKEKEINNQKELDSISDPKLKSDTEARFAKEKIQFDADYVKATIGGTAKIAGASSKMFAENSAGRKALHAVEVGLHGVEMAMSVAKIATSMAAGAAKFFEQSGWAGFAGVAAMVAVMAGFGIMAMGGGGSGPKDTSTPDTKTTGTVLGDSEAASNSMEKVIDTLNSIHGKEYAALRDIVDNFKNMSKAVDGTIQLAVQQHGIFSGSTKGMSASSANPLGSGARIAGSLGISAASGAAGLTTTVLGAGANALIGAGATGVGTAVGGAATGAASASISTGLAMGASSSMASMVGGMALGLVGGLVLAALQYGLGKLLGIGKVKFESIGYGIVQNATTMIVGGAEKAINVFDYTKVKQTVKGWFSDTVKIYDVVNGVNNQLSAAMTSVFNNFNKVIADVGKSLNIEDIMDKTFTIPKIKLSFTKLKSDEISKKITDALNTTMDIIIEQVTNGFLKPFAKMGEGALETFVRIAGEVAVITSVFKKSGYSMSASGLGLITMAEGLLSLYESSDKANDGLKNFLTSFDLFIKTVTTTGEKLVITIDDMASRLADMKALADSQKSNVVAPAALASTDIVKTIKTAQESPLSTSYDSMAALGSTNIATLLKGIDRIVVGYDAKNKPIFRKDETTGKELTMTKDEKEARLLNLYGMTSTQFAASDRGKSKGGLNITAEDIKSMTGEQLKGPLGIGTYSYEYLQSKSNNEKVTIDKKTGETLLGVWATAAKDLNVASAVATSQTSTLDTINKFITNPTQETAASLFTGDMTKLSDADLKAIAQVTSDATKSKNPELTMLLSELPKLKPVEIPLDPLKMTAAMMSQASKDNLENAKTLTEMLNVFKGILAKLPNPDLSGLQKVDGTLFNKLIAGMTSGTSGYGLTGVASKTPELALASLTTDKLTDAMKKNIFGGPGELVGKYLTTGTAKQQEFWGNVANLITGNDANRAELAIIREDIASYVNTKFPSFTDEQKSLLTRQLDASLSVKDPVDAVTEAIKTITGKDLTTKDTAAITEGMTKDTLAERISAISDSIATIYGKEINATTLKTAIAEAMTIPVEDQIAAITAVTTKYDTQLTASNKITQTLTDSAATIAATLTGIQRVKDIAESAISKGTSADATKKRVADTALFDIQNVKDVTATLLALDNATSKVGSDLVAASVKWLDAQDKETQVRLGYSAKVLDANGKVIQEAMLSERALKAYDNELAISTTLLNNARTALTNFQKSISDWVQGMKVTQVGNTKTQLDAASRKYDQLLMQINNPATSAEDKISAMTKITGAADSMITAVRNYYGTSKAGADITSKIIDQMDKLPESLTVQELMLGELQKIKDNTAALPKFVGMTDYTGVENGTESSKTIIDTLSKSIAAAMAIDKTNPTLANTAILDAKANIMLVLSKSFEGATAEDSAFLNNLVSAVGGGKGLAATIETTVNSKLGTTTINDVLATLKTSFAGLEVEIQKVKMNPTEENIRQMQADIDKFKDLTVKINGNVEALKLNPDDPQLKKDLQDSLNEMNDFTAKVTGVVITRGAIREVIGDLKESFSNSTFRVNPSLSYMAVLELKESIRDVIASIDTKLSLRENTAATAALRANLAKTFATIDSKIFSGLDINSQHATLSTLRTLFGHIEAVVDSSVNESKKQLVYTSLNRSFSLIPAIVNAQINESARIEAMNTLKVSFKTITETIAPMVDEGLKNKAVAVLDKAFDSIEATVNSTVGDSTKKATFSALTRAFSAITAVIDSDMNDKSKDIVLGQFTKAFDSITANVNSKVNERTKLAALGVMKQAFDTITDDILPMVDEGKKATAVRIMDAAFDTIDAMVKSSMDDKSQKATYATMQRAFAGVPALINSDIDEKSQATAFKALENGFKAVKANVISDLDDSAKLAVANELKSAFGKMTELISLELEPKTMDKALTALDKAFSSIDALITSNIDQKTKVAAVKELGNAFSTIKALVMSDIDKQTQNTAIDKLEKGFSTVEALVKASITPESKTSAVNSLKNALAGIQALINDVVLNPTDTNVRQLNEKLKRFGNLTANIDTTIASMDVSKGAEAELDRDIAAMDEFTADVGLGIKSGATTDLNSQISALTAAIKNIKVGLSISVDDGSAKAISAIDTLKDTSNQQMVFKISIPQINTSTVDNMSGSLGAATAKATEMIKSFDSMLTQAASVQSAIKLLQDGAGTIALYKPADDDIRYKGKYKRFSRQAGLAALLAPLEDKYEKQYVAGTKAKVATTQTIAIKMNDVFNNASSAYSRNLSLVKGFLESHEDIGSADYDMLVAADALQVNPDFVNEASYLKGKTVKTSPEIVKGKQLSQTAIDANIKNDYAADLAAAVKAYTAAKNIAIQQAGNYYTLEGYNANNVLSPYKYAQGGAFTNGIVHEATSFNMGLMGEAGPEAIMPLVQTSGGLGVRTVMPASNDNNNNSEEELREVKKQNQILMAQNAILQEGFKQLISVNNKQADSLDNMESNSRRKSA